MNSPRASLAIIFITSPLNYQGTGNMAEEDPITIDQVEAIARSKLPGNVYNYYSCGADDQTAVERNRTDFDRYS